MNEELLGLLGATPEQIAQARRRSAFEELGLLGQALMQAGAPAPRGTSTLSRLGQAAGMYTQAPRQTMDTLLQDLLRRQQIQDLQARRQQEAMRQQQEVMRQQQLEAFISGLPPEEQARFRAFPTQAAEAMFREQPEQFVQMTPEQVAARGLPANKTFQMSSKTGRISEVGGGGTTVNVGGETSPFQKKAQEGQATTFVEIERAANTARNSLRTANQLEKYLSRVDTGATAALKQFAGNFGIETEGLSDIQAAQALINRLVPQQRPPGSGTMSDADLALFKQSLPRIINQPGGNERIIKSIKEVNEYLIEEGKIAREVLAGKITPEEGTKRMEALKNPLENIVQEAPMPQGVTVRRVR